MQPIMEQDTAKTWVLFGKNVWLTKEVINL